MRGCLFTLLLGAIVAAFVVVVGLPAIAAGIVTAGPVGGGPRRRRHDGHGRQRPADGPPGAPRRQRSACTATDATFRGLDDRRRSSLRLGDVAVLERTAGTVDGDLGRRGGHGRRWASGSRSTTITLAGGGCDHHHDRRPQRGRRGAGRATPSRRRTGVRPTSVCLTRARPARGQGRRSDASADGSPSRGGDLVVRGDDGPARGPEVTLLRGGTGPADPADIAPGSRRRRASA